MKGLVLRCIDLLSVISFLENRNVSTFNATKARYHGGDGKNVITSN